MHLTTNFIIDAPITPNVPEIIATNRIELIVYITERITFIKRFIAQTHYNESEVEESDYKQLADIICNVARALQYNGLRNDHFYLDYLFNDILNRLDSEDCERLTLIYNNRLNNRDDFFSNILYSNIQKYCNL